MIAADTAGGTPMKMILGGMVVAIVLGIGAAMILNSTQRPAYEVYSTSGVRIGDPGHNLVGEEWTGNPRPRNG
jgi:hypothetical protein